MIDNDDQEMIIKMIDAMIVKHRVEGAVQPIDCQLGIVDQQPLLEKWCKTLSLLHPT